jgi:hypothetical protein
MTDPLLVPGEFKLVGRHRTKKCDGGKVFIQTPATQNGSPWPRGTPPDEWFWCNGCGASTKTGNLNMKDVK